MKKAQAVGFVWIFVLVMLFTVGLMYVVLSKPHEQLVDKFEPSLTGDYLDTFQKIKNYWYLWPLIFIPSLLFYMYVKSLLGNEPGYYQ